MVNKYRNVRVTYDGLKFDSIAESKRYEFLKLMQKAGEISDLEVQPGFKLEVEGKLICEYRGDFAYRDKQGRFVVEDVKGQHTASLPLFRVKAKLFEALKGFPISVVGKGVKV